MNFAKVLATSMLACMVSMQASAWKAHWINHNQCQSLSNTWLAFRKVVELDNVPDRLVAKISADSKYWLWINGELAVYEGGLKRGPNPHASYYDTVDIAPYLKPGSNSIAVQVWYFGKNGFSHKSSGLAALLFEAIGGGVEIVSDKSWDCSVYRAYLQTQDPQPNYRLPESHIRFDARKDFEGWREKEYDKFLGRAYEVCEAPDSPMGELIPRPIPLWKDYGLKDYEEVIEHGDTLVCRLPYNCQLSPYIKLEAPAGVEIVMHAGDENYVWPDETYGLRFEYITKEGVQEYESLGWINGHEILYIVPKEAKVLGLKFRETGYDTEFTGSFSCDDPFLNELWNRAARTLYVCMRDSHMDCPDRERAQWCGDETTELGECFYALSPSSHKLAEKGILELIAWQKSDKSIFSPAPAGNWHNELPLQTLAILGWYGAYTQYFFSGDGDFIAKIYEPVKAYLHEAWQVDEDGIALRRGGDWDWCDAGESIDKEALTACWYQLALRAEREFALLLGKEEDAQAIQALMEKAQAHFDQRYWDGTSYRSASYDGQTDDRTQAMAVLSGLAPKERYPALKEVLYKERHASVYMEKYVLEALYAIGEPELAVSRMKERYREMIEDYPRHTTLFEQWQSHGSSHNHAWAGGPLTLLSQKACGVEPIEPGFKKFKVEPSLGPLNEAQVVVDSSCGLISVSLKRKGGKIDLRLSVPEGCEAQVGIGKRKTMQIPAGEHSLSISGK